MDSTLIVSTHVAGIRAAGEFEGSFRHGNHVRKNGGTKPI
jgi:hypothetical protein